MSALYVTRLLGALALGFMPMQAVAATDPAPLGLDFFGTSYALISNKKWEVTVIGSDVERRAREVKVVHPADPEGASAEARQTDAYVWAARCTRLEQQLAFKRTFWMPGPAKTFAAEFDATNSLYSETRPIESFRVFINGTLAAQVDGAQMTFGRYAIDETTETIPQLFIYGQNEIVVEVTKRKQTAAQNKCMEVTTPLGFRFNLHGRFEGDLRVGTKKVGSGCYVDPGPVPALDKTHCFTKLPQDQENVGQLYGQGFSNLGPSGVYSATAFIDIVGSGALLQEFSTVTPSVDGCRILLPYNPTNLQVACDLTKVPKKWNVKFDLKFKALLHFSAVRLTFKVRQDGRTVDPVGDNNSIFVTHTYCRPSAGLERCKALYADAAPDVPKVDVSLPDYWLGPPR